MNNKSKKEKGTYLRGKKWWITYLGPDGKQHWRAAIRRVRLRPVRYWSKDGSITEKVSSRKSRE